MRYRKLQIQLLGLATAGILVLSCCNPARADIGTATGARVGGAARNSIFGNAAVSAVIGHCHYVKWDRGRRHHHHHHHHHHRYHRYYYYHRYYRHHHHYHHHRHDWGDWDGW
jgi:hypothetical protein